MTTEATKDLWVLEWSQRQNMFHVQPLSKTLSFNRSLYAHNRPTSNDYRVLLVGTRADCQATADAARHTLHEREGRK